MKNVTITLDEKVALWARIHAAKQDMNLSRLISVLLEEKMKDEDAYQSAMQSYLAQPPQKLKETGRRYPRREDLYGGYVLTEDLQENESYGELVVINPFHTEPPSQS